MTAQTVTTKNNSSIAQNNRSPVMRRPGRRKKIPVLPYLLILPAMLLFIVFNYYPFFKAVFLSFTLTDKTGHFAKWVGLSNWVRILGKSSFWQVIWITVKMAAINLVFTYAIALVFALLAMKKTRFSKIYQTMYALPMAIASSPAAAIFLFIYRQKNGLLNELLGGAEIGWTTQMPYALWAVCAMTIWMHVGVSFIFLLVGFRNVSEEVLESARLDGEERWPVPVVWNCGGYESVVTLKRLENRVQVYLPDLKYADGTLAAALSGAGDYFSVAAKAIREMVRQVGPVQWQGEKVVKGVIIRHLILPGNVENSLRVLDWIGETFAPGQVLVSLMRQYTPMGNLPAPFDRRVTEEEYQAVLSWMYLNDLEGFTQEAESADRGFIPDF